MEAVTVEPEISDGRSPSGRHIRLGVWFLIVVGVFALYTPVLRNGFVGWDDDVYILKNPLIRQLDAQNITRMFTEEFFRSWTPLTLLSHAIDYAIWGTDPRGHHLTSSVLHSLNAGWVFLLALMLFARFFRTYGSRGGELALSTDLRDHALAFGAAAAALFFAWHPLRVESVACASDRKDLLCAFFLFPSTIAYMKSVASRGLRTSALWYLASVFLFILGLLSKSIGAVWPCVLLLMDIAVLRADSWRKDLRKVFLDKVPFLVPAIAVAIAAYLLAPVGQQSGLVRDLSSLERSLLPLYNITFYLANIAWPVNLAIMYEPPSGLAMYSLAGVAVVLTLVVVLVARRSRLWLAAWLCYVVVLLPTIGIVGSAIQPTADRYTYLPTVSIFLLMGAGGAAMWRGLRGKTSRLIAVSGVAAVLLVLGLLTLRQISLWKDAETIWSYTAQRSPGLPFPHNELGVVAFDHGRYEQAAAHFQRAVDLYPAYPEALNNLGNAHRMLGDTLRAIQFYRRSLETRPDFEAPYINLAVVLAAQGRLGAAATVCGKVLEMNPGSVDGLYQLAYIRAKAGDLGESTDLLLRVLQRDPGNAKAHLQLGLNALDRRDTVNALDLFRRAAVLGDVEAQQFLAENGIAW